jgi:hypothetical protein
MNKSYLSVEWAKGLTHDRNPGVVFLKQILLSRRVVLQKLLKTGLKSVRIIMHILRCIPKLGFNPCGGAEFRGLR